MPRFRCENQFGALERVITMKDRDQEEAFADELDKLVDRFADEFDLSSSAACGVLLFKIRLIQDDVIRRMEAGEE